MDVIRVVVLFKLKKQDRNFVTTYLKTFAKDAKILPGCLDFKLLKGTDDENEFSFVETWDREESFLAHTQSENFRSFAPFIATHFSELTVHKMTEVSLD